jgi:hypothetical protein
MRMRPVATVVVALGIVGIAPAQQANQPPGPQATTKAKLRSQIIRPRAELDVLQLEHDATRAEILNEMSSVRAEEHDASSTATLGTSEKMPGPLKVPRSKEDWDAFEARVISGDEVAIGIATRAELALGLVVGLPLQALPDDEVKEMAQSLVKAFLDDAANLLDRKKVYARQAEELAGKHLDLEDFEKQYHDAR